MAERVYYMRMGENLAAAAGIGWQVGGIVIDNPSGSWLIVRGIEKYVPPYTNQWAYPLVPSQSAVTVEFTDSPSGSISAQIGSPPVVRLYDKPIPANVGIPSGAGARVATVPFYETALVNFNVIGDAPQKVVLTAGVGERLIIRRLSFMTQMLTVSPLLLQAVGFWEVVPPPSAPFQPFAWDQVISPETAYVTDAFEEGAAVVLSGSALTFTGMVENYTWVSTYFASFGLRGQVQFYRENA